MDSTWIGNPRSSFLVQAATWASVAVAALLIIMKLGAWIATDSISLQATLFDSLLDIVASILNLFAVRQSVRPADHEHRFGHGKIEALSALGQSAFIAGSALFLAVEVIRRFYEPAEIVRVHVGIIVMFVSIILTGMLVLFQRYVIRQTRSTAVKADSIHYRADILVNMAVIFALLGARWFGWYFLDTVFGFGIAVYILYTAWEVTREAFDILIDRELPEEQRKKIREIALAHTAVTGVHDIRTRSSGQKSFIQLHMEMDGNLSLSAAHFIADEVASSIMKVFPEAEVIIHQDPWQLGEARHFTE